MSIPAPWEFLLLALAAFRVFKLIADDTILDRPREWIIQKLGDADAGQKLELFITCPWCAGFWITLAWWASWQAWPDWTLIVAAPFALSAVVGAAGVGLSRLAD